MHSTHTRTLTKIPGAVVAVADSSWHGLSGAKNNRRALLVTSLHLHFQWTIKHTASTLH